MAIERTVDPVKLARARAVVDEMARTQREKQPEALDRLKECAGRFNQHTWVHIGSSSLVAAPTVIAGLQGGAIKKIVMVSRDKTDTVPFFMGHALAAFARECGAEVVFLGRTDALLVEKNRQNIPDEVLEALGPAATTTVSVIESIAFGQPMPRPGSSPLNLVDLKPDGTLKREPLEAATQDQADRAKNNMGINPDRWIEFLRKLGFIKEESVDVSYSSWIDRPNYGTMADAKTELKARAVERRADRENGCAYVVEQPATISSALTRIKQGLVMGLDSIFGRKAQGDDLSYAEIGLLTFTAMADPLFSHPFMTRENGGVILGFHQSEKRAFPDTEKKLLALEAEIPPESTEVIDAARADSILRRIFGWPEGWQQELKPIQISEQIEA